MASYHVDLGVESDRDGDNLEMFLDGLLAGTNIKVDSIWVTEI